MDRIPAQCPYCGATNIYSRTELDQAMPAAKVMRGARVPAAPEPQEYIVTCTRCHRAFKITVPPPGGAP
jgi:hypothetical protein